MIHFTHFVDFVVQTRISWRRIKRVMLWRVGLGR